MLHKLLKPLIVLSLFGIAFLIGNKIYQYHTYDQKPVLTIAGLEDGSYHKGVINAALESKGGYKIATIKATLDNKPFPAIKEKVNDRDFSIPFSIDTATLEDGLHNLKLHIVDASKQENHADVELSFGVDNKDLSAALVEPAYKVDQGKTAHIKIQANKPVKEIKIETLNKKFTCHQESPNSSLYECFIPIDCEEKATEYPLTATVTDHVGASTKLTGQLQVAAFNFPKQRSFGFTVETNKLDNEREVSLSSSILDDAINKWLTQSPHKKLWTGVFEFPIQNPRITTPHGEVRMTPERGRYLHRGLDLANRPKVVVWAAQNGTVIIKDRFLVSGNTVVVDHGLGITTHYCHLDSFADIEVGDSVKKGNPVGKVGMTGYADTYHLHWEIRINNVSVDPMEWTSKIY